MAKQTKIKANADQIELNAQTTQRNANAQINANADDHANANANAQGQDMTTQTQHANADQIDQGTTQTHANADQIDQGNAQTQSESQDMTTQHANADQIEKKIDQDTTQHANANAQGNANAQSISLLSDEDQAMLKALTDALSSVDLSKAQSIVQTQSKKSEKSSVKREISSVGVDDHAMQITCLSLLVFGQYVKIEDFTKSMREFARNPVFVASDDQSESDYQRYSRLFDAINRKANLKLDISMIKADRIAVNGAICVDLDDLLVNQYEHGKDSKLSIAISRPELSLGLRLYAQMLNFNAIFDMLMDCQKNGVAIDLKRVKTFSIGDSTQFKHVSSTIQNIKAMINLNDPKIEFYSNQSSKHEILLDYAKSNADPFTLKAISMLHSDDLSCVVKPNQKYPKAHKIKTRLQLMLNSLGQAYDLRIGLDNELAIINQILSERNKV